MDFLQSTNNGKLIIENYGKLGSLDEDVRKVLIKEIVSHFVQRIVPVGTKECCLLAEKIIQQFPNEKKVRSVTHEIYKILMKFPLLQTSYFITGSGNNNAKGALYSKYNNTLALHRRKGLVPKSTKPQKIRKTDEVNSASDPRSIAGSEPESTAESTAESEAKDIEFLAKHNKPWDVITEKWKRTFKHRRDDVFSTQTLQLFLTNWPLLRNASYAPLLVSFKTFVECDYYTMLQTIS